MSEDRRAEIRADLDGRSTDELLEILQKEQAGNPGELPFEIASSREHGLDSPHHLATAIIDPFYEEFFEYKHQQLLDECLAPWILGETVRIDGSNYNPKDFVGLFVGWPRSTFKSSCMRLLLAWAYLYFKIRLKEDLTCMLVHKVRDKAIDHGEGIRNVAKYNPRWREAYPEFAVDPGVREWDRKEMWMWPNMESQSLQAQLWSFVAYGETSSKVGGHYKLRLVDDWEDEDTVNSAEMIQQSETRLKQLPKVLARSVL